MSDAIQLSERFVATYQQLVLHDLQCELLSKLKSPLSPSNLAYLVSNASRLALNATNDSAEAGHQCQLAYDIAVRVPKFANGTSQVIVPLCESILSRIGNFPARALMRERTHDLRKVTDPYLELESFVREEENRHQDSSQGTVLTDFQIRLLSALRNSNSVSVSAPTSAGKSFTLELELLHRLRKDGSYVAIFLVPTRALIRQVSMDLIDLFRANQVNCSVLSSLSIPEQEEAELPRRHIFVLTQERFATLLADAPLAFHIDAIIVDEAQEICKDRRGMTLERVIHLALRRYPKVQLFFSSPLRSNPEYLLSLFGRAGDSSIYFIEHQRPVTQNLILLRKVRGSSSSAVLEVLNDFGTHTLGEIKLPFRFRDRYVAEFAKHFTAEDDVSIIYCNRPSEADKTASELSDVCDKVDDSDLDDFADFLQQEVHRKYKLAAMIRKGVAFHYGNIPQIVRSRIEELAKLKKIKFVCCTSTLLQGVNLPAKNIFLENPKTGLGELGKIRPGDFWNLVGRAGRLKQEFSGNVFCIFGKAWGSDPLSGDRMMPIESAYQVALTERSDELALCAAKPPDSSDSESAWAEQAFANIYSDYVTTKHLISSSASERNKAQLELVDAASKKSYESRTLPDNIFASNMYVHPHRLEELASLFRRASSLSTYCPIQPFAVGSYDNLVEIFLVVELVFVKSNTQRHKYFAFLASKWMQGISIRELVRARLEYQHVKDEEKDINDAIRDLFREIEDDLRYRYVKYTAIYLQVLSAVLVERGDLDRAEKLLPLHLFLEFGASQKVLINLMTLGLSRTSAILLQRAVSMNSESTVADCRKYLESINLDRIIIPAVCRSEIARIRSKSS